MRGFREGEASQQKTLHLVQPFETMSDSFATLRTELKNQNIPFEKHFGFGEVKQLMRNKQGEHIVVIHNEDIEDKDVPADLISTHNLKIFFYPKHKNNARFQSLRNAGAVIKKINWGKSQLSTKKNKIRLNSIKREVSKSPDGKQYNPYSRLFVYGGDENNLDEQYLKMVDYLSKEDNVQILKNKNSIGSIKDHTLLLTNLNNLNSVSDFITKKRMDKTIDLAVLGVNQKNKGLRSNNIVIATKSPIQIIEFMETTGFKFPGLKEKLYLDVSQRSIEKVKSQKAMNLMEESQHKNGQQIQSNLSNSGTKKKVVMKKKKVKNDVNPSEIQQQPSEPPQININLVNSNLSDKKEQIYESRMPVAKQQMHWIVKGDNTESGQPNFVTERLINGDDEKIENNEKPQSNTSISIGEIDNLKKNSTSMGKIKNIKNMNQCPVIIEDSEEHQVSNRQSYLVEDGNKNGIRFQDFQEEGGKKKTNFSEFKGMSEKNNEFEEGKISSDLGISKNRVKEGLEIPSENIVQTANYIEVKEDVNNYRGKTPEINKQFERAKYQIKKEIAPVTFQNNQHIEYIDQEKKNIDSGFKKKQTVIRSNIDDQEKPQLKIRKEYKSEVYNEGPAKIQSNYKTVVKQEILPQSITNENYQGARKYAKREIPEVENYVVNENNFGKGDVQTNGYSSNYIKYVEKQTPKEIIKEEIKRETSPNSSNYISSYRERIEEDYIRPNPQPYSSSVESKQYEIRKATIPEEKPNTITTEVRKATIYENKEENKPRYSERIPYQKYSREINKEENRRQSTYTNVRNPISYDRAEYAEKKIEPLDKSRQNSHQVHQISNYKKYEDYQEQKNNNLYTSNYKEKKETVIDSKNFNFDDYDRVVDERGRVIYKPKKKGQSERVTRIGASQQGLQINKRIATQNKIGDGKYEGSMRIVSPSSRQIDRETLTRVTSPQSKFEGERRIITSNYITQKKEDHGRDNLSSETANIINGKYMDRSGYRQSNPYIRQSKKEYEYKQYKSPENRQQSENYQRSEYTANTYTTKYERPQNQVKIIRGGDSSKYEHLTETKKYEPNIRYEKYERREVSPTNKYVHSMKEYKGANLPEYQREEKRQTTYTYNHGPLVSYNNFKNQNQVEKNSLIRDAHEHSYERSKQSISLYENIKYHEVSPEKVSNPHVYHQTKPFSSSNIKRVESQEDYNKLAGEYENLSTTPNCFHYIVDKNLRIENKLEEMVNLKDTIDICYSVEEMQDKISKKALPNTVYDLGFIFVSPQNINNFRREYLRDGYYLVDVDPNYRNIDVNKQRKQLKLSNIENLILARKLLLGPMVEHLLFYTTVYDSELSRILKLFPNSKFHKIKYTNRSDLESLINIHAKNKGRMLRVFIFTNEQNIQQISSTMDHHLNLGTFTMVCLIEQENKNISRRYPKVHFLNHSEYGSYDSVINHLNKEDVWGYSETQLRQNEEQPIIYLDVGHKNVKDLIEKKFPKKYDIQYFLNLDELRENKNATVVLHPEADYDGQRVNVRDFEYVYMLGNTRKVPSGAIRITHNDLMTLLE